MLLNFIPKAIDWRLSTIKAKRSSLAQSFNKASADLPHAEILEEKAVILYQKDWRRINFDGKLSDYRNKYVLFTTDAGFINVMQFIIEIA